MYDIDLTVLDLKLLHKSDESNIIIHKTGNSCVVTHFLDTTKLSCVYYKPKDLNPETPWRQP